MSGLPGDHVHWTLLQLTLDGPEEDEHGLTNMFLPGVRGEGRGGVEGEEGEEGEGGRREKEGKERGGEGGRRGGTREGKGRQCLIIT